VLENIKQGCRSQQKTLSKLRMKVITRLPVTRLGDLRTGGVLAHVETGQVLSFLF
jgi:hypothetical protein